LASIPTEDFERRIGSPAPPTITELAAAGTAPRDLDVDSERSRSAIEACQPLVRFAEFCRDTDPLASARAMDGKQAAALRNCVELADRWLDQFVVNLQQ
jgi:hypothetical protein